MHIAAAVAPRTTPQDLGLLLAELDDLTERASLLRVRLARTALPGTQRPGWPIRRLDRMTNAATLADGGA